MKVGLFGNKCQQKNQIEKIFSVLLGYKDVELYVEKQFNEYLISDLGLNYPIHNTLEGDNFPIEMAISIGGDGTFLKTASLIERENIPILGINTGRLGFLADVSCNELEDVLPDLLDGRYRIEERSQLSLNTVDNYFEDFNLALNEVAILKQDTASMLTIHAHINGEYLTSYQADGLVIATPTGSTAYSLSVGGPIMMPDASNFILTPIAPHSLTSRPLVVSDKSLISLRIESRNDHFLVSLDGRSNIVSCSTELEIKRGSRTLKVVKRLGHTFYNTLREKLMWGADSRLT